MAWTPYLTELSEILADLYEPEDEARRVLRVAGLRTANFRFSGDARTMWHNILYRANNNEEVPLIVDIARREHPNQGRLAQIGPDLVQGPDIANTIWRGDSNVTEQLEKIIGKQSTLLPITFLEIGLDKARSVVRVERGDGSSGSGFLTDTNLLITNNHVIANPKEARNTTVQFNYQKTAKGLFQPIAEFQLDPDSGFATSIEHDWTAVRFRGDPCKEWGSIPLQKMNPQKQDRVIIIQHPGGGTKQIALYHNLVVYVGNHRIQYLTDTTPGSSGSPVFDSDWNLVALHHSGGWITEPGSKKEYYRNEGIHINTVIDGLTAEKLTS